MEEMTNDLFTLEMQILFQNLGVTKKNILGNLIKGYYDGNRATKIIDKLNSKEVQE